MEVIERKMKGRLDGGLSEEATAALWR